MKRVISAAFSLAIVFSATIHVFAKGDTTKVVITSSELQSPVEISDPEVLKNFNVWSGPGTESNGVEGSEGFIIDWASGVVTERPSGLRTFELSFYVRYANRPFAEQTDQLAYVVSYAVDLATGQGYVYLPGKTDEAYRLNTKAIYREREGNWFRATAQWQRAFRSAQAPPNQTVAQGQEWVAFDADYTSPRMYGRYYRASDGSMRQEGADPEGKRPSFISIINIARKEAYFYSSQNGTWRVQPVIVPADGYRPMPFDPLLVAGHRQLRNVLPRPQRAELFVPPAVAILTRIDKPITLVEVVPGSRSEAQLPFGRGPEPIPEKP